MHGESSRFRSLQCFPPWKTAGRPKRKQAVIVRRPASYYLQNKIGLRVIVGAKLYFFCIAFHMIFFAGSCPDSPLASRLQVFLFADIPSGLAFCEKNQLQCCSVCLPYVNPCQLRTHLFICSEARLLCWTVLEILMYCMYTPDSPLCPPCTRASHDNT